jgi:hypothetical protein
MTDAPLPTIQMFWHGPPLSRLERLSMASFQYHGHPVDLYVYDESAHVPAGVRVRNAEEILPRATLFRHKRTGSFGLFSDWFRYRLLYARGGIWADSDIVCLRPFDHPRPQIFAWQDNELICGAVLGLPASDPLASWLAECCESPNRVRPYDSVRLRLRKWRRYLQGNRRDRVRWGENGPRGLTAAVRYFGYLENTLPSWHFYPVPAREFSRLFETPHEDAPLKLHGSYAVHLWNNLLWRAIGPDRNRRFVADSLFERLCARYLRDEALAS